MTSLFSRGSEWRKWDLHVHTPASFHWNDGKRFCEMTEVEKNKILKDLIEKINQSDVAVFGIMDYWTFDGYFELMEFLNRNPDITCNKTILPGMELRVEANTDFRLNTHFLLSDKLSRQNLLDFKSSLFIRIGKNTRPLSDEALTELGKSYDPSKAESHGYKNHLTDDKKCLKLGSETAEITRDCLQNAQLLLPSGFYLIIQPYDTSNGLKNLKWQDHPQADNYFMQSAHIFETRKQENIDLFLGNRTEENEGYIDNFVATMGGKPKPVVSGSDAHRICDYGIYPSDKVTWIKSDPTFDGLKQTIYDPAERVCITPNHPNSAFPKPYFQKIEIEESQIFPESPDKKIKFADTSLELNSGLVAIIGGRGAGKSILLDAIAKTFNKPENEDRESISMSSGLAVTYAKNTGETEKFEIGGASKVEYLHVHQREVQKIVKDIEFLSKAILNMLRISSLSEKKLLDSEEDIDEILNQIKECQNWLKDHSQENSQSIIDSRNQVISTITTDKNQQIINNYSTNIASIKACERHLAKLSSLESRLKQSAREINQELKDINNLNLVENSIKLIDFTQQLQSIDNIQSSLDSKVQNLKNNNTRIQESLADENIEGDPTTLFRKINDYRSEIETEQEIIRQIDSNKDNLNSLLDRRNLFVEQLDTKLNDQVDHINQKWQEKLQGRAEWKEQQTNLISDLLQPITIYGEIYFDVDEFYS